MKQAPAIALLFVAFAVPFALATTPYYEGTVSDAMCEKKHMMPGKSDAECIHECVKASSAYVLVSGSKVYSLAGKPEELAKFAGKKVHVQGQLKQDTITVNSIQ